MAAIGYLINGAPFVKARIRGLVPRFEGRIDLLIDTGAAHTALLDRDAEALGLAGRDLAGRRTQTTGVGGPAEAIEIPPVTLTLRWGDGEREFRTSVYVIRHPTEDARIRRHILRLPSLLGRDVLKDLRFVFEPAASLVRLEAR